MNHADHRVRRGAHRTGRELSSALVPSLLAVLCVSALVTALYVWRGEEPGDPEATAAATTSATSAASATTTTAPAATRTTHSASPSHAPPTTTKSTEPTASSTAGTPTPAGYDVPVVVLNQTTRSGLAASVADYLRGRGWQVTGVGNFHGVVPATTVYYPPGQEDAALAAATALPTTPRIRPRFGNLSTTRLTVVVTSSYPG